MLKIEKTITSLEVAEVTGKLHKNVIKEIRTIIEHLVAVDNSHGSKVSRDISSYFIEGTYVDNKGERKWTN